MDPRAIINLRIIVSLKRVIISIGVVISNHCANSFGNTLDTLDFVTIVIFPIVYIYFCYCNCNKKKITRSNDVQQSFIINGITNVCAVERNEL